MSDESTPDAGTGHPDPGQSTTGPDRPRPHDAPQAVAPDESAPPADSTRSGHSAIPGDTALPGDANTASGEPYRPARHPEPSLPDPAIPYVHGRDLVPLRVQPRKYRNTRHDRLFAEEDALRRRIRDLDQHVLDLAAERRQHLQRIKHIHDELRPRVDGARGRRRRAVTHEEPLPPIPDDATHLIGRALRAVCTTLLRQARRPLTLRELHVLLHRLGYNIAHPHPAKTLADALAHETHAGRATRTQRATYQATPPPPHEHHDNQPDHADQSEHDDRPDHHHHHDGAADHHSHAAGGDPPDHHDDAGDGDADHHDRGSADQGDHGGDSPGGDAAIPDW